MKTRVPTRMRFQVSDVFATDKRTAINFYIEQQKKKIERRTYELKEEKAALAFALQALADPRKLGKAIKSFL